MVCYDYKWLKVPRTMGRIQERRGVFAYCETVSSINLNSFAPDLLPCTNGLRIRVVEVGHPMLRALNCVEDGGVISVKDHT